MLPSPSTKRFSTLVELLEHRASEQTDQLLYTFLDEAESAAPATMTYGELGRRARRIGASLQALAARGERVVLLYPPGLEYNAGFFGALYATHFALPHIIKSKGSLVAMSSLTGKRGIPSGGTS